MLPSMKAPKDAGGYPIAWNLDVFPKFAVNAKTASEFQIPAP